MMTINPKRLQETFIEMCRIYSPSKGEEPMAQYLMEKLSVLDLELLRDDFGNLIAKVPAYECEEASPIFFSAHLDVVEPCNNVNPVVEEVDGQVFIKSDGTTVLGADDKAGIAMIVEMLTSLIESNTPHGDIDIVFTLQEENGLFGVRNLDTDLVSAEYGFVFDHSGEVGSVITKAPQHDILNFTFKGKASHAGLNPEDGVSAIKAAACAVVHMPTGKIDDNTTANVGTINGGVANNIIANDCTVTGEVRSHNLKTLNSVVQQFLDAANRGVAEIPGSSVKYTRETEYKNISIDPASPVVKYVEKAATKLGLNFYTKTTCGGSDASVFNHIGFPTVCLGCGYANAHSTDEYITLENLVKGTELALAIVEAVMEQE